MYLMEKDQFVDIAKVDEPEKWLKIKTKAQL
jgi:hypothetical protein